MKITPIKPNLTEYERLFLSLGDKTRLKLLSLMADKPVSVGFLVDELGESQPKVSRHLAYLRNSGVVNTRREGKCIYYGIQKSGDPDIDKVIKFVIGTISGETPVESSNNVKLREGKTDTDLLADKEKRDEAETVPYHNGSEHQLEIKAELVDYIYQEEEASVSEVCFENETKDEELEVFLL